MRSGQWGSGHVRTVSAAVAGLDWEPAGVSVSRQLPSPLPDQVAGVGGWAAATGRISAHEPDPTADRVSTPWSGAGWPKPGLPVEITATDGANSYRIFKGQVDGTTSSLATPEVEVPVVDSTDQFEARFSHAPLMEVMPPLSTIGTTPLRYLGLRGSYITNYAARKAGFFMTPPRDKFCAVFAPLVGATWPETGDLVVSRAYQEGQGTTGQQPAFVSWEDSVYATDLLATYTPGEYDAPWNGEPYWTGQITPYRPLNITLGAALSQGSSSAWVSARWNDIELRLAVTGDRYLLAQMVDGASVTNVVALAPGAAPGWKFATMRVEHRGNGYGRFKIVTDTGVESAQKDYYLPTGNPWSRGWSDIQVLVPQGNRVHGVQVSYGSGTPAAVFTPTFRFSSTRSTFLKTLPTITAQSVGDLLKEQSGAECASLWVNEDGVLRWASMAWLKGQTVKRVFESDEIADAKIQLSAQDVKRRVVSKHVEWSNTAVRDSRLIVYEGPKDEFMVGDRCEQIITPAAGEEWIRVDSTAESLIGDTGAGFFNSGFGSWKGFTAVRSDGSEIGDSAGGVGTSESLTYLGPSAWRWAFRVNSLPPNTEKVVSASRSEEGAVVLPRYRNRGLPLLRAMGRAMSVEAEYASTVTGPAWAAEFVHDFGSWVQLPSQVKDLTDWLASELVTPSPVITDFEVLPDPRLMLGDMIEIRETARTGLIVRGVVIRIEQSISAGEHAMSVDLLILKVTTPYVSLEQFESFYAGMSLAEVEALFADQSWQEMETNPIQARPAAAGLSPSESWPL